MTEKLGNIDIEQLELIKAELFEKASDPLINDALVMIMKLEKELVTVVLNHKHYCEHTAETQKKLYDRISELSWSTSPDRSGGQFTDEEISRSQNGGW